MEIIKSDRFNSELRDILRFIAKDSKDQAKLFKKDLFDEIFKIPNMPYKHRQSLKSDQENIRELIFKGYVFPFRVKGENIELLGVFSSNLWEL